MIRHIANYILLGTAVMFGCLQPIHAQGGRGGQATPIVSTPRTADGHPDLTGRWGGGGGEGRLLVRLPDGKEVPFQSFAEYENALAEGQIDPKAVPIGRDTRNLYRHGNNDYSGKDEALQWRAFGNPPLYKPQYWEKIQSNDLNGNNEDPTLFSCQLGGIPRMGPPMRIIQTEKDLVFLYTNFFFMNQPVWRVIPIDGRPHHPVYSKDQTYMGDSVGHWEGDTMVIDIVGFTDETWLGWPGWIHTSDMRVVEKFRREGNLLHYDVTVYDPEVLIEPWQKDHQVIRINNSTVYTEEAPCLEADRKHIVSRMR